MAADPVSGYAVGMDAWRTELLATLRAFEGEVAGARAAGAAPDVRGFLTRIGELEARAGAGCDPQLRHYLQRRSYEKARLWLEGEDPEAGPCPR